MTIRCVVTGQRADGKSVFAADEQVEPITVSLMPGLEFHRLWGSDVPPTLPTDGCASASAKRSEYRIDRYWLPRSL